MRIPSATYRLQFHSGFGFEEARRLVPYLDALGVSDLYASPLLAARRGSTHGYDVTDPSKLNPELGPHREFDALSDALRAHGMGLLLDVVPNHMAMSSENPWWIDVLEHGRASRYAGFFDIDWAAPALEGKVLVPVLGGPYAEVLDRGELTLALDEGGLSIRYAEHRFPVDPATYDRVFGDGFDGLRERLGPSHSGVLGLRALLRSIERIPPRRLTGPRSIERRARISRAVKEWLRELLRRSKEVREFLHDRVLEWGGDPTVDPNRERLDSLIAEQAYLLSYWRAAVHEIDYRRFFDVTELVSLRAQIPAVFEATHAKVLELLATGGVTGLRIDHVDGLHDPQAYLERLQRHMGAGYVVVEKILAESEHLRSDWPAQGTTGYDFLEAVNAVLVHPAGVAALGRAYARIAEVDESFPEIAVAQKRKVMEQLFGSEVGALSARLQRLARGDRRGRDLTQADLATALVEATAALPVYRTYLRGFDPEPEDRRLIEGAVTAARGRVPADAQAALEFLRNVLLVELPAQQRGPKGRAWLDFAMRWQQFTGPVMAKGVEDTAMYVYARLLSRNDVGADPGSRGITVEAFHRRMRARARTWPGTLDATSTHDTKRGEDVRARINVLSEMPDRWTKAVDRWMRINAPKRTVVGTRAAPDPNEEWLIYQTLIGAWPLERREERGFLERMAEYVRKALREEKVHTNWIDPDAAYEAAVERFLREVIRDQRFRRSFLPLRDRVAFHGAVNGLSQALVKLTAPGVPDLYQGSELWNLSLVDPDNRRAVDFERRVRMLAELDRKAAQDLPGLIEDMLANWPDGRIKLWVTSRALRFRRANSELFARGSYLPLKVTGPHRANVIAFARRRRSAWAIVVVPRLTASLSAGLSWPVGERFWETTTVVLPNAAPAEWAHVVARGGTPARGRVSVASALSDLPLALMSAVPSEGGSRHGDRPLKDPLAYDDRPT